MMRSANRFLRQVNNQVVATTATSVRSFGSGGGTRGARGHGWWINYRAGKGGKHLQGEYSHLDVDALHSWNDAVFSVGSQSAFMDVLVEPILKRKQDESAGGEDLSKGSSSAKEEKPHRLVIELASQVLPRATENFKELLSADDGGYRSTRLHRIEKKVGLVGGNVWEGTGKCAEKFRMPTSGTSMEQTEHMVLSHLPGVITMLCQRVNEIDSRFILCTHHAPHMDGRSLVIGRLDAESLQQVQGWESSLITRNGVPRSVALRIVDCGVLDEEQSEETA